MKPVHLKPIYDKTIWANDKLTTFRGISEKGFGTCWEVSAHPWAKNVIVSEENCGKTLYEVIQENPEETLGKGCSMDKMLRLAYLDAAQDLSIQVHPYDSYAREHENDEGKTEAWYIIKAEPNATLVAGTTVADPEEIRRAIKEDKVEQYVRKVPVQDGDFVCIDAGMLHALGKGIFAIEVGQNSNVTYRFYDYHRKDDKGNERPLHLEKSFDVADFSLEAKKVSSPLNGWNETTSKILVDRREFTVELLDIKDSIKLSSEEGWFYCLSNMGQDAKVVCDGEVKDFAYLENVFIPASCSEIEILGSTRLLKSYVRKS
ncbi:MAG: class I mannose-6-phosphate isomerase [Erysipelotrichaceae bacterium]|nr:class I mannose-6-phosphate isomerase [Erysipelotrichaceae bacterium]